MGKGRSRKKKFTRSVSRWMGVEKIGCEFEEKEVICNRDVVSK